MSEPISERVAKKMAKRFLEKNLGLVMYKDVSYVQIGGKTTPVKDHGSLAQSVVGRHVSEASGLLTSFGYGQPKQDGANLQTFQHPEGHSVSLAVDQNGMVTQAGYREPQQIVATPQLAGGQGEAGGLAQPIQAPPTPPQDAQNGSPEAQQLSPPPQTPEGQAALAQRQSMKPQDQGGPADPSMTTEQVPQQQSPQQSASQAQPLMTQPQMLTAARKIKAYQK